MKPVLILQNCEIESAGTIVEYLEARHYPYVLFHNYRESQLPDPTEFSAVISLGTPVSVTNYREYPYLQNLYELTAKAVREDMPYLGICFGGQLLARVLGAEVKPNGEKEIGTLPIRLTEAGKQDPLFAGFEPEFPVFQWHGDTFRAPFGSKVLAESDACPRQAFRRGKQAGIQFHLEAGPNDVPIWAQAYAAELIEVSKSLPDLLAEFHRSADRIKQSNYQLLDNFFHLTQI